MLVSLTLVCCLFLLGACVVTTNEHGKESTLRMKVLLMILMSIAVVWCLQVLYFDFDGFLIVLIDLLLVVVGRRILYIHGRYYDKTSMDS